MAFGFGKKKKETPKKSKIQLSKNIEGIMKDLKKERVLECQNLGMTINKMGQDLSFLDKKIRGIYNEAIKELKVRNSHEEVYEFLKESYASSDIDRNIIDRIFSIK